MEEAYNKILSKFYRRIIGVFLEILVLTRLRDNNTLSGRDVMEFISKEFHTLFRPSRVYTLLYSLERDGLIIKSDRKGYRLTDKGKKTIRAIENANEKIENLVMSLLTLLRR